MAKSDEPTGACPRCKGRGWVREIDWLVGVATLGFGILLDLSDHITCTTCNGTGILR